MTAIAQPSDLTKRLFEDESQNDFEDQGAASAAHVFVTPVPLEPAIKRVKIEDLASVVLQMQRTMQEQSLGIMEAVRVASAAANASMSMASAMQQGFSLMGPLALPSAAAVPQPVPDLSTPVGLVPAAGGAGLRHIPPDLEKHISKVTSQFEKQVVKFIRNKELLAGGIDQLKVLDEPGAHRYPSGIRPFKSPEERADLDACLNECQISDCVFTCTIEKGSTRRAAMQQVHHCCTRFLKAADNEGRQGYVDSLRASVTRKAFVEACTSWKPEVVDSLELDEPCRTQINDALAVARVEKAYAQVVDRVRERKAAQVQQQADEEKRKKDENNLLKHKPEVLLHDLIDERVSARVQEMSGDSEMNLADQGKADGKLSSFVQSLQKNGLSPGVASGSASKGNQNVKETQKFNKHKKNKGKGKGKANQNKKKGTPVKKDGEVLSGSPSPGKGSEGISSFSRSPERQPPYSPLRRPQQNWKPQWIQQGWGRGKGAKPSGSGRGGNVNAQRNPQQWSGPGWGSWR